MPYILVVDDNQADLELLDEAIHEMGEDVVCRSAKTADQGVQQIADMLKPGMQFPRAIILDLRMPGHDGIYLLRHVRGHDVLRDIPVVMLTSSTWQKDSAECLRLGADHFRVKPKDWSGYKDLVVFLRSFWRRT